MELTNLLFNASQKSDGISSFQSSKYSRWREIKQDPHTNQVKQFCDQLDLLVHQPPRKQKQDQSQIIKRLKTYSQTKDKPLIFILPKDLRPKMKIILKPDIVLNRSSLQEKKKRQKSNKLNKTQNHGHVQTSEFYYNEKSEISERQAVVQSHTIELPHIPNMNLKDIYKCGELGRKFLSKTTNSQNKIQLQKRITSQSPTKIHSLPEECIPKQDVLKQKSLDQQISGSQLLLISQNGQQLSQRALKNRIPIQQQYSFLNGGYYRDKDYYQQYKESKLFLQMSSLISKKIANEMKLFQMT